MGYETRKNQKYYYRKERVGKKVISIYLGKGPEAKEAAKQDRITREKKAETRRMIKEFLEKQVQWGDPVNEFEKQVQAETAQYYLQHGFTKRRGEWRPLMKKKKASNQNRDNHSELKREDETLFVRKVLKEGIGPDIDKVIANREKFANSIIEKADGFGESYMIAEHMIEYSNCFSPKKEIFRRNYYRMQEQLQINKAGGLARCLLERVALAWLRAQITEHEYTLIQSSALTLKEREFFTKYLESVNRMFSRAVSDLVNARNNLGAGLFIQINNAGEMAQQVNINNPSG